MESPTLTDREAEIMKLIILEGMESLSDISERLNISPKTIKNHYQNMYRKLGVKTKTGAVVRVLMLGLIELPYIYELRKENRSLKSTVNFVSQYGRLPTLSDFDNGLA